VSGEKNYCANFMDDTKGRRRKCATSPRDLFQEHSFMSFEKNLDVATTPVTGDDADCKDVVIDLYQECTICGYRTDFGYVDDGNGRLVRRKFGE